MSLAAGLLRFARVLRAAGLPLGTGRVLDGLRAVDTVGVERRDDFYWALHAVFVNRPEQHEVFDQAFRAFWRSGATLPPEMAVLLPRAPAPPEAASRRVAEAMGTTRRAQLAADLEHDATMTHSDREALMRKDFEEMSAAELRQAREIMSHLRLPVREVSLRRHRPDPRGRRLDARASLRAGLRLGGDLIGLRWRAPVRRPPPIVVICDISGSMARYSRVLMHFVHGLAVSRARVHTFLFGTRLSNVTRHLRHRDVDVAVARVVGTVSDWSGGTRIGACLNEFNKSWSRRVLGQGALVLLISDGLDRDEASGLSSAMERLGKSCRRLIWLNPLLRYAGFEPRAQGIRAMLPHVDELRPVHNLEALASLAEALNRPASAGRSFGTGLQSTRRGP